MWFKYERAEQAADAKSSRIAKAARLTESTAAAAAEQALAAVRSPTLEAVLPGNGRARRGLEGVRGVKSAHQPYIG